MRFTFPPYDFRRRDAFHFSALRQKIWTSKFTQYLYNKNRPRQTNCYVYAVKIKVIHIRYRNHSCILDLAGILNFVFQVKFNLICFDDGHSYL